jgi:hypothetical protein
MEKALREKVEKVCWRKLLVVQTWREPPLRHQAGGRKRREPVHSLNGKDARKFSFTYMYVHTKIL